MSELALAQIAVNDGTENKIFRHFGPDDPASPNEYGLFGGYLPPNAALVGRYENPHDGMIRLLREQTHLDMRHGEELLLGSYHQLETPKDLSIASEPVKIHFFEAFIRQGVNAEQAYMPDVDLKFAFEGVKHAILTNEELLKKSKVVPVVRFILEQMAERSNGRSYEENVQAIFTDMLGPIEVVTKKLRI